jgi:hypothetical protein
MTIIPVWLWLVLVTSHNSAVSVTSKPTAPLRYLSFWFTSSGEEPPSTNYKTKLCEVKLSYPCNRTWRPIRLRDVEDPTYSRQSAHRWRWSCQPYQPTILYSPPPKKTPWPESASELHRPSDRRLSAKWLPIFADRGWHVVSVTDSYGRILGFLDRRRYFSIK